MSKKIALAPSKNAIYNANGLIKMRHMAWEKADIADRQQVDRDFRESVAQMIVEGQEANGKIYDNLYKECCERPEKMIELTMSVVNKDMEIVPFFLNEVQIKLAGIIHKAVNDYDEGKRNHLKFLILKGRQQGFTTFISGYVLANVELKKNTRALTLTDCDENTTDIFTAKAKHPFSLQPNFIKPEKKYDNRRELMFQNEEGDGMNSSWRVATATKDIGRSKTLNFFHGSEVAFWIDAMSVLTSGLSEALTKRCITFLESTANGSNYYKQLWDEDNNWECLFFEWWETSEYRMNFESKDKEKRFRKEVNEAVPYDDEHAPDDADTSRWAFTRCKWLLKEVELEWEQIYWYYTKWRDSREKIKQEYPCTAKEAFLASGKNYFNVENIDKRIKVLKVKYDKRPVTIGNFEFEKIYDETMDEMIVDPKSVKFVEANGGIVEIYHMPVKGEQYALGGDTAGDGSDHNIASVINTDLVQCADVDCEFDEDLYAEQAVCLGYFYNEALAAIETNFSTHPQKVMMQNDYPNLWVREVKDDSMTSRPQKKYGWNTNKKTRPTMLADVRKIVREYIDKIESLELLDQMTIFVKNEKGRPDHEDGGHDDRIIAYAIAVQVMDQVLEPFEDSTGDNKIKGYYTRDELEDLGYSEHMIEEYMENRKIFQQITRVLEETGVKEYYEYDKVFTDGIYDDEDLEDMLND